MITVTVESDDNGFIVKTEDGVSVFEEDDTHLGECKAASAMLYAVLEAMGAYGSKHDDYRVRVAVIERDTEKDMLA